MAAVVTRLQAAAKQAAQLVREKAVPTVVHQYTDLMARNQQYVVKDAAAAEKLGRQFVFTKLASLPQHYTHAQKEAEAAKMVWKQRSELSVSEAAKYGAFGAEVFAWFCIGEIIGRGGSISGYNV